MRVLGIDFGAARIGIAIGDMILKIASPYEVIQNKDFDDFAEKLIAIIDDEGVERLVIGLPLNMDGGETPQTKSVQRFIKQVKEHFQIDVVTEDERLTSRHAEELLKNADMKQKNSDDVAAMVILQAYFDRNM